MIRRYWESSTKGDETFVRFLNRGYNHSHLEFVWDMIWKAYESGHDATGAHTLRIAMNTGIFHKPGSLKRVGLRRWRY